MITANFFIKPDDVVDIFLSEAMVHRTTAGEAITRTSGRDIRFLYNGHIGNLPSWMGSTFNYDSTDCIYLVHWKVISIHSSGLQFKDRTNLRFYAPIEQFDGYLIDHCYIMAVHYGQNAVTKVLEIFANTTVGGWENDEKWQDFFGALKYE